MSRGVIDKPPADYPDERVHRNMIADFVRQEAPEYTPGPPSSGVHVQGDKVWNDAPASGNPIGWVCTVSGDPGTWKGFGVIIP